VLTRFEECEHPLQTLKSGRGPVGGTRILRWRPPYGDATCGHSSGGKTRLT